MKVLVFRECGQWVAQGLELDIVAQGITEEVAMEQFQGMFYHFLFLRQILLDFQLPPAPDVYHRQLPKATLIKKIDFMPLIWTQSRPLTIPIEFYRLEEQGEQ